MFYGTTHEWTEPTFLEYQWLSSILLRLTRFTIEHGRFGEIGRYFRIDDILVGKASLEKGKPHPLLEMNLCYDPATA